MKYRVVEKPHPKFPYNVDDILNVPNPIFEWVGIDGELRWLNIVDNSSFEKVDEKDITLEAKFNLLRNITYRMAWDLYVNEVITQERYADFANQLDNLKNNKG